MTDLPSPLARAASDTWPPAITPSSHALRALACPLSTEQPAQRFIAEEASVRHLEDAYSVFAAHWEDLVRNEGRHVTAQMHHARVLMAALAAHGSWMTLSTLTSMLGLSRPTVTKTLHVLIERGLVQSQTSSLSPPEGGRPPTVFRRTPDAHYAVALRITRHHVEGLILDTCGRYVARYSTPVTTPSQILAVLGEAYSTLAEHAQGQIHSVCVAVMGIVRPDGSIESGLFPQLNQPEWELSLRRLMPADAHLLVRNDAKAGARWMDMHLRHHGIHPDSFIAVECSHDLGCALVFCGNVWEGEHGAAGEVALSHSGQWAHALDLLHRWDRSISVSAAYRHNAVTSKAAVVAPPEAESLPRSNTPSVSTPSTEVSQRFIQELGQALGEALTPMVLLLDPAAIVIGGEAAWAGNLLPRSIEKAMSHSTPSTPTILLCPAREECVISGAALEALHHVDAELLTVR